MASLLKMAVAFNTSQQLKDFVSQNPIRPGRNSASGRAALERRTVQEFPMSWLIREYTFGSRKIVEAVRTVLAVPILKGDDIFSAYLGIYHLEEVRPFTGQANCLGREPLQTKLPSPSTTSDCWTHFAIAPMN